jgi:tetratricopeptide (TPR) repeat protein
MTRITCLAIAFAAALTALVGNAAAQQGPSPERQAQAVANRAIADLAAWKNQSARNYLQNQKAKFGTTPQFQTAWALLEIQEGAVDKKAMVDSGVTALSKMSKNTAVDAVAAYFYGEILYQQKKRPEATAAWQAAAKSAAAAVKADPNDATAQFYLGAALVRAKRFEEARTALRLAVRGGFDEPMVNHQIGLSYLFAEKWKEAKDAFDLGLSVDPRYAPMYFYRAMAWDKLGRKADMLIDLDQYVKLAPNGPDAGFAKSVLKSSGR